MEAIETFLRPHVMGKTLYTAPLSYSLEGGLLEGEYSDQMSFTNLLASPTGMRFDLLVVSQERIHVMDGSERKSLCKDFSGASHFHYELARRRSSGRITDFMRYVAASFDAVPAEAMASAVIDMRLEKGEVRWSEKEMIYRDQPGADGGFRPVAFEASCRFYLEDGKACYEYDGVYLDVDPEDMSRKASDAAYPKFIAREK